MRCASQPGVLADRGPTHRAAGRACQGQAGRTGLRRDLRRILLAGAGRRRGPRPAMGTVTRISPTRANWAPRCPRRPDPAAGPRARQASGYPAVFRSAEPRPAVQPAPGGEQNRPRGADGRDRVLKETETAGGESYRVQLETERLHGAGAPGTLSTTTDTSVDAELTIAEQEALLGWLAEVEDEAGDEDDAAALRRRLAGVLANLPEALKRHLEALLQLENGSSRRASGGPPRWTGSPKSSVPSWKSPCAGWRGRCTARSRTGAESPPPAGSTPAAPCGATCGSTECHSCRSRCGAPRTGHGWSYSRT